MNKLKKAILNPSKTIKYIIYTIKKHFGHKYYKKYIILTRSRTGSNMLVSYLNSHPNIYCAGEIFARTKGFNFKKILNSIFSMQPKDILAAGFKIFYYHPCDNKSSGLWGELINDKSIFIIHLKRKNILRTIVSRKIAGKQDIWAVTKDNVPNKASEKKVHFSFDELLSGFIETRNWECEYEALFKDHPLLNIYYEDIVQNPQTQIDKITAFLGMKPSQVRTEFLKQNPEELDQLISNYKELKNEFLNTEWSDFFT